MGCRFCSSDIGSAVSIVTLYAGNDCPDAQRRLQILSLAHRHGVSAACEAFELSRRTLILWGTKLKAQGGNVAALAPGSTAPKRRRRRSGRCP